MIFLSNCYKKQKFGRKFTLFLSNMQQKEKKNVFFLSFAIFRLHKKGEYLSDTLLKIICTRVRVSA